MIAGLVRTEVSFNPSSAVMLPVTASLVKTSPFQLRFSISLQAQRSLLPRVVPGEKVIYPIRFLQSSPVVAPCAPRTRRCASERAGCPRAPVLLNLGLQPHGRVAPLLCSLCLSQQ